MALESALFSHSEIHFLLSRRFLKQSTSFFSSTSTDLDCTRIELWFWILYLKLTKCCREPWRLQSILGLC